MTRKSQRPSRRSANISSQSMSYARSRGDRSSGVALTMSMSRTCHPTERRMPESPSAREASPDN
eukprot:1579966-Alexandrium_andersonii.AAC.1